MSGEKLNLEPFQSGSIIFAGIKQAGLVYRISPVERRQSITVGALEKDTAREIDLSTQLEHDFLITGISADIIDDDAQVLQDDRRNNYDITYVQLLLQILDRNTNSVIRTLGLFVSGNTPLATELILTPKVIYRIRTNLAINSITLTGKPVYMNTPLVYL